MLNLVPGPATRSWGFVGEESHRFCPTTWHGPDQDDDCEIIHIFLGVPLDAGCRLDSQHSSSGPHQC